MSRSLKKYLANRNLLAKLTVTLLFLFTLSLGVISIYALGIIGFSWVWQLAAALPLPIYLYFGIAESQKIYHEGIYDNNREVLGQDYVKIKSVVLRIVNELEIGKKIKLLYEKRGRFIGMRSYQKEAHIIITRKFLSLHDSMIDGVIAHELIHIYNDDLLKFHKVYLLAWLITVYTLIIGFVAMAGNLYIGMVVIGVLGLAGTLLTMLPLRIMEETADCGTAYLGYGSGLVFYLGQYQRDPVIYGYFSTHDSTPRRLRNVLRVTDEINGND